MGKYTQGILGAFSGKVGTVVGSSWRGIKYMRSLGSKRGNAGASKKQLEQQARFALINGFLRPVKPLLEIGFKNYANGRTGYNSASSYNLKNALTGETPNLQIDYSMVLVSRGDLTGVKSLSVTSDSPARLNLIWEDNTGKGQAKANDQVMVAIFIPSLAEALYAIGEAERQQEALALDLPEEFSGETAEVYVSFAALESSEVSTSLYAGNVIIA